MEVHDGSPHTSTVLRGDAAGCCSGLQESPYRAQKGITCHIYTQTASMEKPGGSSLGFLLKGCTVL
jgi:hypothetical protein